MIRVGVIGLGMGAAHLPGYRKLADVKIEALCDLNKELMGNYAKEYEVPLTFTDYKKMLELKELDAVSIALPNYLHCPVTIEALESGKHVLVEKPMALDSKEAERMAKKAKEKKKILMVAMNYRYTAERQFLKRLIEKGALGKIYYIRAISLRRRTFPRGFAQGGSARKWFADRKKSGGGALVDMGPHLLDLACWFVDNFNPVSVYGVTSSLLENGDVDDLASALIKLKDGPTISLESTWESYTKGQFSLALFGTKAGAVTDPLRLYEDREETPIEITLQLNQEIEEDTQSHFLGCIKEGKEPGSSGEKGLMVMKILDAIYASARTGKIVLL